MANKSIDELASELTIALLEFNAKLEADPVTVEEAAKNFEYFRQVMLGQIDPLKD